MQSRGEYIRADGLVIPNNVTIDGAAYILAAAFRGDHDTLYIGLCDAVPETQIQVEDAGEAFLGTGGYARQAVADSELGWPYVGAVNNERYIESDWVIFPAGVYSRPVQRLFLCTSDISGDVPVLSFSAAFATPLAMTGATPEASRKFKYRLYLR